MYDPKDPKDAIYSALIEEVQAKRLGPEDRVRFDIENLTITFDGLGRLKQIDQRYSGTNIIWGVVAI